MQIGLFEVQNEIVIPDEVAVRLLPWMRHIREKFPNNYMQVYGYLFYMCCWDGRNIYINRTDEEREQSIIEDLHIDFSLDEPVIIIALEKCKKLYETPAVRAFKSIKNKIDDICRFLDTNDITSGKNGNAMDIKMFMKELPTFTEDYDKLGLRLKEEQTRVRGMKDIAYDQENDYVNSKRDQ